MMRPFSAAAMIFFATMAMAGVISAQTTIWNIPDSGQPGFGDFVGHAGESDGDSFAEYMYTIRSDANAALLSVVRGAFGVQRFALLLPSAADIDNIGDVDGDTIDDIGVLSRDPVTLVVTVYLYSGSNGVPISLPLMPPGAIKGSALACEIEGLGDINSDGRDDFAIAFTGGRTTLPGQTCPSTIPGTTVVYSGLSGGALRIHPGTGGAAPWVVSRLADITGDGISEYAIGGLGQLEVPQSGSCATAPEIDSVLEVFSGVSGQRLQSHPGAPLSGLAIDNAGDINLDGFPDILAKSRDAIPSAPGQLLVHIMSGTDGTQIYCFDEFIAGSPLYGIYPAGDINGDYSPEFFVVDTGAVRLASGATSDTIWTLGVDIPMGAEQSVAHLGDLNNDAGDELILTQQNPLRITVISALQIPQAATAGVGQGFGRFGTPAPELSVSPTPAVGETITIAMTNGTPNAQGALLISAPAPITFLPTGHPVALDLGQTLVINTFSLDAAGAWSRNIFLQPNAPVLGRGVQIQCYAVSGNAPGGLEVTNGVFMRFGPPLL